MGSALIEAADLTVPRERMRMNTFNPVAYWDKRVDELLSVGVKDAASFLDEHVPGWAGRITKPLVMYDVNDCVLGQVFGDEPGPRRFFGLLPPKKRDDDDIRESGFWRGSTYLLGLGLNDRPFVFSSSRAVPYWGAEITRRTT